MLAYKRNSENHHTARLRLPHKHVECLRFCLKYTYTSPNLPLNAACMSFAREIAICKHVYQS